MNDNRNNNKSNNDKSNYKMKEKSTECLVIIAEAVAVAWGKKEK